MTSGQGVSRLAYQKAYAMKGGGPKVDTKFTAPDGPRDYAKGGSKSDKKPGINIDYEHTIPIRNLESIEAVAKGKPGKSSVKLDNAGHKKFK